MTKKLEQLQAENCYLKANGAVDNNENSTRKKDYVDIYDNVDSYNNNDIFEFYEVNANIQSLLSSAER